MPKPLDLVLFYADLGRPYLPLIEHTTRSARNVMPEARLVLLTPTPSPALARNFDLLVTLGFDPSPETLCYDKVRAIMTWQAQMDRPCAFIDPDLEFRRPIEFPDSDVGLLWRKKAAQPVNAGMILAKPGSPLFWKKYGTTAASLPRALRAWWCDQLAFSVMFGTLREAGDVVQALDASVALIDENRACAPPERAHEDVWAIHYKGARKPGDWAPYFAQQKGVAA